MGDLLIEMDGRADMTRVIGTFCNYADVPRMNEWTVGLSPHRSQCT